MPDYSLYLHPAPPQPAASLGFKSQKLVEQIGETPSPATPFPGQVSHHFVPENTKERYPPQSPHTPRLWTPTQERDPSMNIVEGGGDRKPDLLIILASHFDTISSLIEKLIREESSTPYSQETFKELVTQKLKGFTVDFLSIAPHHSLRHFLKMMVRKHPEYFDREVRATLLKMYTAYQPDFLEVFTYLIENHADSFDENEVFSFLKIQSAPIGRYSAAYLAGLLMKNKKIRLTEKHWALLKGGATSLTSYGSGYSPTVAFMRAYLDDSMMSRREHPVPNFTYREIIIDRQKLLDTHGAQQDLLIVHREQPGRSHYYKLPDGRLLVLKYPLPNQSIEQLARETFFQNELKDLPAASYRPLPLVPKGEEITYYRFEDGRQAIAFIAESDYYATLDLKNIPDEDFYSGLEKAIIDDFYRAKEYDYFHTVPVRFFHTLPNSQRGDQARFAPLTDIARNLWMDSLLVEDRAFGMGRLHDPNLTDSNFGITGRRDDEEYVFGNEIEQDTQRWTPEFYRADNRQLRPLVLAKCLFAAAEHIGQRLAKEFEENPLKRWEQDSHLSLYAKQLLRIHAVAHAVLFLGLTPESSLEDREKLIQEAMNRIRSRADWTRWARQFALFKTSQHAAYCAPGSPIDQFPIDLVFGDHFSFLEKERFGENPYFKEGFGYCDPAGKRCDGPYSGQYPIRESERAMLSIFWE